MLWEVAGSRLPSLVRAPVIPVKYPQFQPSFSRALNRSCFLRRLRGMTLIDYPSGHMNPTKFLLESEDSARMW